MEVEGFDSLAELALDLRWSWNHAADELWRRAGTAGDAARPSTDKNKRHPLQRAGARNTPSHGLYSAYPTAVRRRCSPLGIRSYPVATLMKTPQRELHEYILEISEHAAVRVGWLGQNETGAIHETY
jgi:hypothetical protein